MSVVFILNSPSRKNKIKTETKYESEISIKNLKIEKKEIKKNSKYIHKQKNEVEAVQGLSWQSSG